MSDPSDLATDPASKDVPTISELIEFAMASDKPRVGDLYRRRIKTIPPRAWASYFRVQAFFPRYYIDLTDRHLHFSIYPTSELGALTQRQETFGTAFPDLFDSSACGYDVEPSDGDEPTELPLAGTILRSRISLGPQPIVLIGDRDGGSVFKMELEQSLFQLRPDSHLIIQDLTFQKHLRRRRFEYRIYLSFIFGFGKRITPFNVFGALEGSLSYFVHDKDILGYARSETNDN